MDAVNWASMSSGKCLSSQADTTIPFNVGTGRYRDKNRERGVGYGIEEIRGQEVEDRDRSRVEDWEKISIEKGEKPVGYM